MDGRGGGNNGIRGAIFGGEGRGNGRLMVLWDGELELGILVAGKGF